MLTRVLINSNNSAAGVNGANDRSENVSHLTRHFDEERCSV